MKNDSPNTNIQMLREFALRLAFFNYTRVHLPSHYFTLMRLYALHLLPHDHTSNKQLAGWLTTFDWSALKGAGVIIMQRLQLTIKVPHYCHCMQHARMYLLLGD